MVLTEAMSAGVPVVALDAPGAREALQDGENGALVEIEDAEAFAGAIRHIAGAEGPRRERLAQSAREFAREFNMENTTDRLLETYQRLGSRREDAEDSLTEAWNSLLRSVRREWDIWSNRVSSLGELSPDNQKPQTPPRS
jgi:hypothetical protein